MESAQDIAAQIAATRERFEQLAGPIESSKGQAEAFADALAQLGLEERSAKAKAVADRVEQHQSLRAGIAGGLAKAHWLMLSVANGTMGPGANGPTSSVIDNVDGTTSWHGTVDGIKTEIVYGHQPEIDPGPIGQVLIEETRPKSRAAGLSQIMVKEDATDPAKFVAQSFENLNSVFRNQDPAPPAATSTPGDASTGWVSIVQQPVPEVRPIPVPTLSAGQMGELAMVVAVIMMKAPGGTASTISKLKNFAKERKRDDHE